jgi:hypothetical protein
MRALLLLIVALAGPACSALVQGGLPRLTNGCTGPGTIGCGDAGSPFMCADGGCMILGCNRDADCAPFGLHCYCPPGLSEKVRECLNIQPDGGTICDGG